MKAPRLSHIQIIALGYFIMITAGTLLLMLPFSARGESAGLLTALFTATSASCVTGLILENTVTYWSAFGQAVIIVLIQIGGLGFMTVATYFWRVINRHTGLRERAVMAESINSSRVGGLSQLTKRIILGTLFFELVGAALLSTRFIPRFGILKGFCYGLFHSISAFCNAGFDLLGDKTPYISVCEYSGDVIVSVTIMALIVIGGIGFLVWDDIATNRFHFKKYRLHTKLILIVTALLVVGGALLLFLFEREKLAKDLPLGEQILTAFFGSVTARTAGFNSLDTAALSEPSKLLTTILMFIGGSPGSTAGGIKTSTIMIIFLFAVCAMRGETEPHIFERRMEEGAFKRACLILTINLILCLSGALIICGVQDISVTDSIFETASAIGTVGMSTGITRDLNTVSRLVIIFLMYCGRVGSISFALAVMEKRVLPPVSYPTESVTIG